MNRVLICLIAAIICTNCENSGNSEIEEPLYEWRQVGLFNNLQIVHMDYSDEGILTVSTKNKIFYSANDGEYFNVLAIPDSVDIYKVRIQEGHYYLVSNIFDYKHGTTWTGKTKMLYYKENLNSEWEYITGRFQLFDVIQNSNKMYIGVLNGVSTLDLSNMEGNKVEFFRSRLSDLIDDMILFDGYVLASSHEGVFGSNDDGETWQDLTRQVSKEYDHIFNMETDENGNLHAMSQSRVYYSTDANFDWEIRYLKGEYDDVSIIDSKTYVGVEFRNAYLLEIGENNGANKYDITPPKLLSNSVRRLKSIRVSENGTIFLRTEQGFFIGTPNPNSQYWH